MLAKEKIEIIRIEDVFALCVFIKKKKDYRHMFLIFFQNYLCRRGRRLYSFPFLLNDRGLTIVMPSFCRLAEL